MKIRYVLLLAAFLVLSVAGHAQTHRQFHAGQLVLDNDSTTLFYYTIKTPDGMTVSDTFSLPIPPPNNPPSGFVYMGNNINDILQWKVDPILYPMGAWVPVGLDSLGTVKGLGTPGQVTYWATNDSITGNNNFLWDTTNFTLTVGDGSSNQHLAVNGTADATGTEAINSGVWDLAVTGDIAATGIIKSGAGVVIDGVNVPHQVSADQPLTVTTSTGGLTLSTTDATGVVQVGNTAGTSTNVSIGQSNTVTGGDGATAIGYNNNVTGVSAVALGQSNQATNSQAIAMGTSATASGQFSVAMGQGPTASAQGAVAMGQGTKATGPAAVAMGELTTAPGWSALAMGFQTHATGNFATAIGTTDSAAGVGSFALGNNATANNSGSFVFGDGSAAVADNGGDQFVALATGGVTFFTNSAQTFYMKMDNSGVLQNTSGNTIFPGGSQGIGGQAINWSIPNPGYALSVTNTSGASTGGDGVGIFVTDNTSSSYALNVGSNLTGQLFSVRGDGLVSVSAGNLDMNGHQINNVSQLDNGGNGVMVNDSMNVTGMLAVGGLRMNGNLNMNGNQINNVSEIDNGSNPVKMGSALDLNGNFITDNNTGVVQIADPASGTEHVSIGQSNTVTGNNGATAIGNANTASGTSTLAEGNSVKAGGDNSIAMGQANDAEGYASAVIGQNDTTTGNEAMAFGQNLTATGTNSIVLGQSATANNPNSFVFGDGSARAFDNASNQFIALATGGVTFFTNSAQTFYMKMDNSGVLQNTSGNTIFPGGSQGIGGQAINWSIPNPGYALSVTNTSGASTGGDGVGIFVADNTSSSYALNVGSNLTGQLFSVRGDGLVSVSAGNLDMNSNQINNVSQIDNGGSNVKINDNLIVTGTTTLQNGLDMSTGGITNVATLSNGGNGVSVNDILNVSSQYQIGGTTVMHQFGTQNIFVGASSGNQTMTGAQNAGFGVATLPNNTTGGANTAIGYTALQFNTTGGSNTAVGGSALFNNTIGGQNTAMGLNALFNNTTGSNNTAIGGNTMLGNTTGNNNTALGEGADVQNNVSNSTALGGGAIVTAANTIQLGNSTVTDVWTSGKLHLAQVDNNGSGLTVGDNLTVTGNLTTAKAVSTATVSDATGTYTVGAGDFLITETAAAGTVTLPAANAVAGRMVVIYNGSTGAVTVARNGTDAIAGGGNFNLAAAGNSVTLISDGGTNWVVMGSH